MMAGASPRDATYRPREAGHEDPIAGQQTPQRFDFLDWPPYLFTLLLCE